MNFDQAFDLLISAEGGYVFDPRAVLKYVNEFEIKNRSRIGKKYVEGAGICGSGAFLRSRINFCPSSQLASVRMSGAWMRAPRLRKRSVQCALHTRTERVADGVSGAGQKARGCLRMLWRANRRKGWLGVVPAPLQASPIRNIEGRCSSRFWLQVRTLRRVIPSRCVRLSSSRRQDWASKRDVLKQVDQRLGARVVKVHLAMRKLSPNGTQR